MWQNYNQTRRIIDEAKDVLRQLSIDYNSIAGPLTLRLIELSKQIMPLVKDDFPEISSVLCDATRLIINRKPISQYPYGPIVYKDFINAYAFGDIRTAFRILDALYSHQEDNSYKIFISHSSDDETIVNCFIKDILMLGCGFKRTEIFCTLDHTAIRTGDNFRNEIIKNMKSCDYIIFMISDNYRNSEVCQNEMGAAWALDGKRVLPFKFPNIKFTEIGFLNVVKQVADITDKSKLDELYDDLSRYYEFPQDWVNYNKQKDDFINIIRLG